MTSGEASWLEEAKKQVQYRREALAFLGRARQQFEVSPSHASAVAKLWLTADQVDGIILPLLEEMNRGLLESRGELETVRGASLRSIATDEELLFYDCSWTLLWDNNKGIAVNLAVEPFSETLTLQVFGQGAKEKVPIGLPVQVDALKEALVKAYATEETLEHAMIEFSKEPMK